MTAPLMPYSATWRASGSTFLYPSASQRGTWIDSYYKHRLGPGSYMLQVTYFSLGKTLNVEVDRGEILHTFEAGQIGWLRSPMIQVVVLDNQEMFLIMKSTQNFREGPEKAALNVYPMEPYKP